MKVENHGITVNVGEDGAWICMKTNTGKSFCFQPIQKFGPTDHFRKYVEEWCSDIQKQLVQEEMKEALTNLTDENCRTCSRCGEEVGELDPDGCRDPDCPMV